MTYGFLLHTFAFTSGQFGENENYFFKLGLLIERRSNPMCNNYQRHSDYPDSYPASI